MTDNLENTIENTPSKSSGLFRCSLKDAFITIGTYTLFGVIDFAVPQKYKQRLYSALKMDENRTCSIGVYSFILESIAGGLLCLSCIHHDTPLLNDPMYRIGLSLQADTILRSILTGYAHFFNNQINISLGNIPSEIISHGFILRDAIDEKLQQKCTPKTNASDR